MWRYTSLLIAICLAGCSTTKAKSDNKSQELPPKLLRPEVRKIWIPPTIKNGGLEWEEGHYLYRIERDTTWSR